MSSDEQFNSPKNGPMACYVRQHLGPETVSDHLFLRMARIYVD